MAWRQGKDIHSLSKTLKKATSKNILEMLDTDIRECSGFIRQKLMKADLKAQVAIKKTKNAITAKKRLDWCLKKQ